MNLYPSDIELVEGVRRLGNVTALARELGIAPRSLQEYVKKDGHRANRVEQARQEHFVELQNQSINQDEHPELVPVDDPQRIKIDQQNAELKVLRKERTEYSKALAKQEGFFDRIVEATRVPVQTVEINAPAPRDHLPTRSVVLPIYDQQFGQFVRSTDTPVGRGNFSVEVFDYRLARYVEAVLGSLRDYAASHFIEELIFVLGGDHVEGDEIFAGQTWQLELDPPRQVWELAIKMTEAISTIVRFAKEELGINNIAVYGVTGNHGRVGGKKAGARPNTYNWDWLFLKLLQDRLRSEPIDQFEIEPGGSVLFSAADHVFLAIHGDEISGWGGIPFYGLTRYDGRAIRLHRVLYDFLLMGHHHQPANIPNGSGETFVSGDWVGANNLSRYITAASRPQQRILYVAQKYGIVETSNIYFTTAEEASTAPVIHNQ